MFFFLFLILLSGDFMKQNLLLDAGVSLEKEHLIAKKKERNVEIKHYLLKESDEKIYRNRKGDYFTLTFDDQVLYENSKTLEKVFQKTFKTFLAKYHKGNTILFVGLGNSSILGDSFGTQVLNKLIATNQYNDFLTIPKVALFAPETTNKTGISSFRLIEMVVKDLQPDVIILLDSFVTNQSKYLNRTLEINDCGMIFADQLRSNKTISFKTFHIPVLSIGFPTLLKLHKTYLSKYTLEEDLEIISSLVARSINHILMS